MTTAVRLILVSFEHCALHHTNCLTDCCMLRIKTTQTLCVGLSLAVGFYINEEEGRWCFDWMLQLSSGRWRTGSPWLLDCYDKGAGKEEQSSPTFDLQWHGHKQQCLFTLLHFCPDDNWSIQSKCRHVIYQAQVGNRWPSSLSIYRSTLQDFILQLWRKLSGVFSKLQDKSGSGLGMAWEWGCVSQQKLKNYWCSAFGSSCTA